MKLKFWGTRGLISSPSKDTAVYGGNTSCIQLEHKNQVVIIDTGFGACNLGEELMQRILNDGENLQIHIFYSHFHWDHIQGLPFFIPSISSLQRLTYILPFLLMSLIQI